MVQPGAQVPVVPAQVQPAALDRAQVVHAGQVYVNLGAVADVPNPEIYGLNDPNRKYIYLFLVLVAQYNILIFLKFLNIGRPIQ